MMATPEAEQHLLDLPGSGISLRTIAIIVYVTLAILALAIPQAAVNWLTEFSPGRSRDTALVVARGVQDVSQALRLDVPYREGRRLFLAITDKRDD
jgi:hypothetical protein